MKQSMLSSVVPILAAPWHQRRNAGSMLGMWVVVGMAALIPGALFILSVVDQFGLQHPPAGSMPPAELAANLRHTAMNALLWALGALSLAGWALTVANLLDQNRPVLARLLPGQPARLRTALLVGWAVLVAWLTVIIGVRFDEPMACATVVAAGAAVLAASVRWPFLWMLGIAAPIGVDKVMKWPGLPDALAVVRSHWDGQPAAIFLTVVAAAVVLLVSLIQSGGARHIASDEARRQRVQRFRMRATGKQPVAVGTRGITDAFLTRLYYLWFNRVVARPSSRVFSRVMLALGPGAHWTASASAVLGSAIALFGALGVLEAVGLVVPAVAAWAPDGLASISVGVTIGLLSPALQIQARLSQSRREQALVTLLPGVPRGAVLNRRLAWQLSGQFLMAWAGAMGLAALNLSVAHALRPEVVRPLLLQLCTLMAVGSLPLVAFQWRAWSRTAAPSALSSLGPLLTGGLVFAAAWAGPFTGFVPLNVVAALAIGASLVWCAVRWVRMGREPSALPFGRLAG